MRFRRYRPRIWAVAALVAVTALITNVLLPQAGAAGRGGDRRLPVERPLQPQRHRLRLHQLTHPWAALNPEEAPFRAARPASNTCTPPTCPGQRQTR